MYHCIGFEISQGYRNMQRVQKCLQRMVSVQTFYHRKRNLVKHNDADPTFGFCGYFRGL